MTMLIFGCGYLGERVAIRWRDAGEQVVVVTRSAERGDQLRQKGLRPLLADIVRPETLNERLPEADVVLFAVGFDRTSGQAIEDVYAGGLRNVLAALPGTPQRFIYISTTGVYGGTAGEWVDETTPPQPSRAGARASLKAETSLATAAPARGSIVLRLAGIYGPRRVPYLDRLRTGEPLPVDREGWLNLIHVDDAASVVLAAAQWKPTSTADEPLVLNVADGRPVRRGDYYCEVARQAGMAAPRFTAPDPASPQAVRAALSRRVRTERLSQQLAVPLRYPSYREGLAAILSER